MEISTEESSDNKLDVRENIAQFDYENVKEKFYIHLHKNCPKTVNLNNPCWQNCIEFVIKTVLDGKTAEKNNKKIDEVTATALKTYDVINTKGKDVLVFKDTLNKNGDQIIVVSNEECFELLVHIHIQNNHADYTKMMSVLNESWHLRHENVSLFLRLCNTCNPKSKSDFGPPFSLYTLEPDLFSGVISILYKMCPEFYIEVETIEWEEIKKYDEMVKYGFCDWMSMTGCTNWATGCRMVQWKLNNMETDGKIPFESLFGIRCNNALHPNPAWLHVGGITREATTKAQKLRQMFNLSEPESPKVDKVETDFAVSLNEDERPQCIICLHTVYRISFCTVCKRPMHSFCGSRFVGKKKRIYSLCLKCKASASK
ncbi:uncharacterized protein LOC106131975 [Amyelois transitella]|uniref:uncharacterized protein LOC106131975 n=1 Tax=Amyelois transitella TaxID=680683 RepID=UPI00067DEAFF|nr:uncharacterized protein LOC106131975 [Amyelois transitella]